MSWNGTETVTTRVDPATDYRHRLELVEDALAAVLGRAAAAPAAREERDRCAQVAERILTKANALVGRLASPPAEPRPVDDGAALADMIERCVIDERDLTDAGLAALEAHRAREDAAFERELHALLLGDAGSRDYDPPAAGLATSRRVFP